MVRIGSKEERWGIRGWEEKGGERRKEKGKRIIEG